MCTSKILCEANSALGMPEAWRRTRWLRALATDGTDVWIVNSNSDKVYRYSNAAGRLSESQTGACSFSLNSGNTEPRGIVTDGTDLWVVNDSSTDKVFKYTLSGSLVGSWTIVSGNKTPTGLTIDPSNGSQHIWIVDSGTDRVYQYANGRLKTSKNLSASATFILAAGNSNPQGIADPPPSSRVPSTLLAPSINDSATMPVAAMAPQSFAITQLRPSRDPRADDVFDRPRIAVQDVDMIMGQLGSVSATALVTAHCDIHKVPQSSGKPNTVTYDRV